MQMQKKMLFLVLVLFISSFALLTSHELAHKQIAVYHGCTDYKFGIDLQSVYFQCLDYRERSEDMRLQELNLHSQNEVFGYMFIPMFIIGLGVALATRK